MKDYLKDIKYNDLEVKEVSVNRGGSNLIEMTDDHRLAIIELLRSGHSSSSIKHLYKVSTKSFTKAQILSVELDWKEALAELKAKEV